MFVLSRLCWWRGTRPSPHCSRSPKALDRPPPGSIREKLDRLEAVVTTSGHATEHRVAELAHQVEAEGEALSASMAREFATLQDALTDAVRRLGETSIATIDQGIRQCVTDTHAAAVRKPVILDLIACRDRVAGDRGFLAAAYRRDPTTAGHLGCRTLFSQYDAALASIEAELLIVLNRLGVSTIEAPAGRFDPHIQRVVGVEPTEEPDRDGHVCRIVRPGYTWSGHVLRPEEIVVHKHKETVTHGS